MAEWKEIKRDVRIISVDDERHYKTVRRVVRNIKEEYHEYDDNPNKTPVAVTGEICYAGQTLWVSLENGIWISY